jgi:sugar lactone lactonase YvrE
MIAGMLSNRQYFCSNASWHPNSTAIIHNNSFGVLSPSIFITENDTLYLIDQTIDRLHMWSLRNTSSQHYISTNWTHLRSVFVTPDSDVYVAVGSDNPQIKRWTNHNAHSVTVMLTCASCFAIFVDNENNLYCSMDQKHQVVSKSLNNGSNSYTIVAGTGVAGSSADALSSPLGIFVDSNLDLYVADHHNDRIQLFAEGNTSGITINVNGSLKSPVAVIVDTNNDLFVIDSHSSRVVIIGPNKFRCIVGCNANGQYSHQLSSPMGMAFDTDGNLFVVDTNNSRIHKFTLANNACSKCRNKEMISMFLVCVR